MACVSCFPLIVPDRRSRKIKKVWRDMIRRCTNPKATNFRYYGGRGISVCPEWISSSLAFADWSLANGFRHGLELDRKDTNGNYGPDNCRWVTHEENMQNRRQPSEYRKSDKTSRFRGVHRSKNDGPNPWTAEIRIGPNRVRLGSFPTEEDAACAFDAANIAHRGAKAVLNFPQHQPTP